MIQPDATPDLHALRERVHEHEQVIEGVYSNTRLMAQQVSGLSLQVQELARDVRTLRDETPAMLMASAIAIVGNPEVWAAGRAAMASHARDAAGGWLLGWMGSLFTKPLGILVLLLVLYQFGGIPAVWGWIKTHIGG